MQLRYLEAPKCGDKCEEGRGAWLPWRRPRGQAGWREAPGAGEPGSGAVSPGRSRSRERFRLRGLKLSYSCSLQNCERIILCPFKPPKCGDLLQRRRDTNAVTEPQQWAKPLKTLVEWWWQRWFSRKRSFYDPTCYHCYLSHITSHKSIINSTYIIMVTHLSYPWICVSNIHCVSVFLKYYKLNVEDLKNIENHNERNIPQPKCNNFGLYLPICFINKWQLMLPSF